MSWQQNACQEVGNVVARLLGGAVLLCVASNAVFLFYLPSRRSRGSDDRRQAQRSEGRQPASSRGLGAGPLRRSGRPARLICGEVARGPLDGPQTTDGRAEKQQRPQLLAGHRGRPGGAERKDDDPARPGTATQSPGFSGKGQPLASCPYKLGQVTADARWLHNAGLRDSGSPPRQQVHIAEPPHPRRQ